MTICRYCGREHEARILCRGVSRRAFLFFGAAAAVTAVAPTLAPTEPTSFVLAKDAWQFIKNHPGILDRMKFEGALTGALRDQDVAADIAGRRLHVDAELTKLSVAYQSFPVVKDSGGSSRLLAYDRSSWFRDEGPTWSRL